MIIIFVPTSCGGTLNDTVRRSVLIMLSRHGMMKNNPEKNRHINVYHGIMKSQHETMRKNKSFIYIYIRNNSSPKVAPW